MLDEGRRTEMIYFLKEVVSEAGVSDKLAQLNWNRNQNFK